jgi:hypothetical protein
MRQQFLMSMAAASVQKIELSHQCTLLRKAAFDANRESLC